MTNMYFGLLAVALFASYAMGDPLEKCQARNNSYAVGDSEQCDKFYDCGTSGKLTERLCDDGFVFSLAINQCDYPHNVNCSNRPHLQPTKSTNPQCPRMNGFYAFPWSESCSKFYHCLEGSAYEKNCPEGVIFDDTKGACVHPDLAARSECSATKVLNFICPNAGKRFSKLRFGDHDRHAHESDCRKFFVCTTDGQPRIGGCPLGKVFNPKTGFCDQPKRVPNCVDYYGKKQIAKVDEDGSVHDQDEDNSTDESVEESQAPAAKVSNQKAKLAGSKSNL